MVIQWQSSPLKFFPVEVFVALTLFYHGNAIIHRANNLAKIASHAFIFFNGIGVIRFTIR